MGTTGIFSDAPYRELSALQEDMLRFAFDTCFCFQWSLFGNFVKARVLYLVDRGLLSPDICKELKKRERHTEAFLRLIDSGEVFGQSPFKSILPVQGWTPRFEECDIHDLDKIRKLRNQLVHAAGSAPTTIDRTDQHYERSMWVLRLFAGNLDQAVTAKMKSEADS